MCLPSCPTCHRTLDRANIIRDEGIPLVIRESVRCACGAETRICLRCNRLSDRCICTTNPANHAERGVAWVGPFDHTNFYHLTVDGFEVPYITAWRFPRGKSLEEGVPPTHTETVWRLDVDGRYLYDLTETELQHCLPLVMQTMAIAAGYSTYGAGAIYHPNKFGRMILEITSASSQESNE